MVALPFRMVRIIHRNLPTSITRVALTSTTTTTPATSTPPSSSSSWSSSFPNRPALSLPRVRVNEFHSSQPKMKGPPRPSQLPKERKRDKYARLKEVRKRKREEKEKDSAPTQSPAKVRRVSATERPIVRRVSAERDEEGTQQEQRRPGGDGERGAEPPPKRRGKVRLVSVDESGETQQEQEPQEQPGDAEKEAEPFTGPRKIRRVGSEEHGKVRPISVDRPKKTQQKDKRQQWPGDGEEEAGYRMAEPNKFTRPRWRALPDLNIVSAQPPGMDWKEVMKVRKQEERTLKKDAKERKKQAKLERKRLRTEAMSGMSEETSYNRKRNPGIPQVTLKETARSLLSEREQLPIFPYRRQIRRDLRNTDVMLLVGETGSGKSTQVPQYLVDEVWCQSQRVRVPASPSSQLVGYVGGKGTAGSDALGSRGEHIAVGGCIAVTEPRRVAAISLARRVAKETGSIVGTDSSMVGYSVRFDNSTSYKNRIKYMTDGVLLQEMLTDPWLTKYSAVVVDEVHERGVNADLLLGFLRNIASGPKSGRGGNPLKVIVMSATADMESLKGYFEEGLAKKEEKRSLKEKQSPKEKKMERKKMKKGNKPLPSPNEVAVCHIEGQQYPVEVIYSPEPVSDFVDAALKTIFQIHYKEPLPGDILVFLTGQETVESLENLVNNYAATMDPSLPRLQVLPLFSALPQQAQQYAFEPAVPGMRKVILATNIAETSVTVPGVRYVVDCGKAKMKQFRPRLGLESLLVKPISKSAAIQRKGRGGREGPGQCYRLYTEEDYLALEDASAPEILRCDISHPILTLKARGVDDVMGFPFLSTPPRESLEKALLQLYNIQALDDKGRISATGHQIAKLPLTPPLGRVLLAAAQRGDGCVRDVVDIISCFSVENIFVGSSSVDDREATEAARKDIYRREGDHLTMLAAVRSYPAENSNRKVWAERHMVSHRAMQAVMDVRKQLLQLCQQLKLLDPVLTTADNGHDAGNDQDRTEAILKSFLAGFATQTARLSADGSYRTVSGNQTVAIHPSSVLYGRKVEAIMYDEYVFTTRSYARGVSVVHPNWVGEVLG